MKIAELLADLFLADVLGEAARPQRALDDLFLHARDLAADHAVELVAFDHGDDIMPWRAVFSAWRMPSATARPSGSCLTVATASLSL